jgi:hypothetical protein
MRKSDQVLLRFAIFCADWKWSVPVTMFISTANRIQVLPKTMM